MVEFNNMTLIASAAILAEAHTQAQLTALALEWGLQNRTEGPKTSRTTMFAQIAIDEKPFVVTMNGKQSLSRAMIEKAIFSYQKSRNKAEDEWKKLQAGLRLDGFEVVESRVEIGGVDLWGEPKVKVDFALQKMLPENVPGTNFREAESELEGLLQKHNFDIPLAHLKQAFQNFSLSHWTPANAMLRNFFEDLLNQIAIELGCDKSKSTKEKRLYLGTIDPPFLYSEYNEWHSNPQKPQYIQGLWARMHPHGSHPGLSEEDDCIFRLQISLVSARLFLRRFDQRVSGKSS